MSAKPEKIKKWGRAGTGYVWLAYSCFYFIEPIFRKSLRFWAESMGIFAVFLLLYIVFIQSENARLRAAILGGFLLLGFGDLPRNPGSTTFLIYAAAFIPFLVGSMSGIATFLTLECALLGAEAVLLHRGLMNVSASTFFILVVGSSNAFVAQQKRADYKLHMAREENVKLASLAERERIARDLHDVLGHTLSVIVLKTELAGRLIERDPARAAREIAEVEKTARTALAEVREAIGGYRSQGLAAELEQARRTLDAAGVTLYCDNTTTSSRTSPAPLLNATEETVLSLAVREAVTNIVRHAEATECRMHLAMTKDGFYSLAVEDDGHNKVKHEGNGLRGMRQRVQAMGGRFSLDSTSGTCVRIELPITKTAVREA